jgi:hypothetical protein
MDKSRGCPRNRVLMRQDGGIRKDDAENCKMRGLMISDPHQYYSGDQIDKNERGKRGILHVLRRKEMHTEFWWRNQTRRITGKV